eukprot:gnl/Dysnectes_brevis/1989_a2289_1724.p1 GENE.gnl/Dysnectes_brevis/1989_a2289_1724~~gnl/Dysnectes_brevis/1989_a2289_1724.p1  ORF type:complete len:175 (+),score=15.66 gnl/Dysnectes_brevis/1989_a2289_1724:67-591(+)
MEEQLEIYRQRRSVRVYDTDKPINPEQIDAMKEVVLRSPTGRNLKPWRFMFCSDRSKNTELVSVKSYGSGFLKNLPLSVTICADVEGTSTRTWVEDCSIAAAHLQLFVSQIGLGSCWVHICERQDKDGHDSEIRVKEVLGLPAHWRVLCVIGIGHPASAPTPQASLPFESVLEC